MSGPDWETCLALRADETLDDLQRGGLRIIQKKKGFRFCTDSVLLADFCAVKAGERVVDMGTGGGVIPLLLAGRTEDLQVDAFETQPELAEMAGRSVQMNGLADRIRIHLADMREAPKILGPGKADLVVTNPPYVQPGTGLQSPLRTAALARGGSETCSIEEWMCACGQVTRNGGRVCVIFPAPQLLRLCDAMRTALIEPKRLRLILSGVDRPPKLVLLEGRRQGRPGLHFLPPLITHGPDGRYTAEMRRIYGETD